MRVKIMKIFFACLAACFLFMNFSVFASEKDDSLSKNPEVKIKSTESVQPAVDDETDKKTAEQRKKIMEEAYTAIDESKKAIKALDEKNKAEALKALEIAIGKMELIVARDPELALAKMDVSVKVIDLYADIDTLKKAIKQAKEYLDEGNIQLARPLITGLASEIVIESVNIPLATYPDAIKAVVPLIDKGETEKAKEAIQTALNTLVVIPEAVIPLPVVRAKEYLKEAETLAEKNNRNEEENKKLTDTLGDAENQLKIAEILGYGKKKAFEPMYVQLDNIREKTKGKQSGKGFFDKIKDQLSKITD